ncbi:MAG: hypothetical protein U9Q96_02720, partial [Patescibacteria group bacterium]|nr:hypothetical protein [Patescibacteria group bacterium]
ETDCFKVYYRNKNTISGDNSKNKEEIIYLINGSAEIIIENNKQIVEALVKIEIPAKIYHKIKALSDIIFVLFEK